MTASAKVLSFGSSNSIGRETPTARNLLHDAMHGGIRGEGALLKPLADSHGNATRCEGVRTLTLRIELSFATVRC
jgi:hypothetical protein